MLTDRMTPGEILSEMTADHEHLLRRLRHEFPRWRRIAIKKKSCILFDEGEWISPKTKNRWLWFVRIDDHRLRSVGFNYGVLRYRDEGMEYLLFLSADVDYGNPITGCRPFLEKMNGHHFVCRFSPHCWQRARERIYGMRRYYGRELVAHVLMDAKHEYFAITESLEAQSATGLRLDRPLQLVTAKGSFLGEQIADGFIQFNTFISHGQTRGRQRKIIGKIKEKILQAD